MNPTEPTGPEIPTASSQAAPGGDVLPRLSRRGFVALGAALGSSCSMISLGKTGDPAQGAAAPARTGPNTDYRTPLPQGAPPRNPNLNLSSGGFAPGLTYSRVPITQPYVAITFDDGPHPSNTPRLLDMLRARNIRATFYVIGRNVDLYPAVVRRTVAEGHEIGNHSYTHPVLSKLSDAGVRSELTKCRDAIARAAGVQPRTMRPPYGALLQRQREWMHAELRYPTILWSVDPLDWKRPGPSVVASRILASSTPGAIILAHDLHAGTVDAMPATLDGLLRKGYKFVTVSQLIALGTQQGGGQAAAVQ